MMGLNLLVLNRISRHSAWAVLTAPRIGRKKATLLWRFPQAFPVLGKLFFSPGCMQTFPFQLRLCGPSVPERGGDQSVCPCWGCAAREQVQPAGTCPRRCSPQTCPPGVHSESSWSSAPSRSVQQLVGNSVKLFLWSLCGSLITCRWK